MMQVTSLFLLDILDAIAATAADLDGAKLHLFTDGVPSAGATPATFTEADYGGYAAVAITSAQWGAPYLSDGGKPKMNGPSIEFRPTDATVSNLIIGYYLTNGTGTQLHAAELFDQPVLLDGPLKAVKVEPQLSFPISGDYGSASIVT